jgi:two-component system, chemotaxis family, CheB/CheR fusion protein
VQLQGKRILLVEDATDIREAFGLLLRSEGADVVAASTGREALAYAEEGAFNVVLTDLGLPDIPGEVLIRQLLSGASPRPRVVVVTGFGEPDLSRAAAAGANAVFTKPIEWTVLLRALSPPASSVAA